jgi:hypothetical protein
VQVQASATESPLLSARPWIGAACAAWHDHFADLIDQHRIAHEINDDALYEVVRQFIAARDACFAGSHETGLRIYEVIPLSPVQQRLLK